MTEAAGRVFIPESNDVMWMTDDNVTVSWCLFWLCALQPTKPRAPFWQLVLYFSQLVYILRELFFVDSSTLTQICFSGALKLVNSAKFHFQLLFHFPDGWGIEVANDLAYFKACIQLVRVLGKEMPSGSPFNTTCRKSIISKFSLKWQCLLGKRLRKVLWKLQLLSFDLILY